MCEDVLRRGSKSGLKSKKCVACFMDDPLNLHSSYHRPFALDSLYKFNFTANCLQKLNLIVKMLKCKHFLTIGDVSIDFIHFSLRKALLNTKATLTPMHVPGRFVIIRR